MDKSNYVDMLKLLNEDKKRLEAELKLIDVAINALTALKIGTSASILTDDGLLTVTNGTKVRKNYYEDVDIVIPNEYKADLTPLEQVLYSLSKIGKGTVESIAGHIMDEDRDRDYYKILPRFRDIASGLYRAGKINADTSKKKYVYSLKEQQNDEQKRVA